MEKCKECKRKNKMTVMCQCKKCKGNYCAYCMFIVDELDGVICEKCFLGRKGRDYWSINNEE